MTPNEYQKEAQRTVMSVSDQAMKIVFALSDYPELSHIIVAALKLGSESGELSDTVVKHICYGQLLDRKNIVEECGDLLWYIALILQYCKVPMEQCMHENLQKLAIRYPITFTEQNAVERLDKK